jgi:predicted transcriptional regulator
MARFIKTSDATLPSSGAFRAWLGAQMARLGLTAPALSRLAGASSGQVRQFLKSDRGITLDMARAIEAAIRAEASGRDISVPPLVERVEK